MAKMKGFAAKVKKKAQVLTEGKDVKLTHGYDPESLTSWHAVLTFEGTVFAQRAVLGILVAQLLTATAVAGLVFHFSSNPERYNTRSIRDFVETLSISIGMLLGAVVGHGDLPRVSLRVHQAPDHDADQPGAP